MKKETKEYREIADKSFHEMCTPKIKMIEKGWGSNAGVEPGIFGDIGKMIHSHNFVEIEEDNPDEVKGKCSECGYVETFWSRYKEPKKEVKSKNLVLEGDYEYFGFNWLEKLVNSNISGTAILEIDFGTYHFRVYDKK